MLVTSVPRVGWPGCLGGRRSGQPRRQALTDARPRRPGGLLLIVFKVPCCYFLITKAIHAHDKDL